MIKLFDIQNGRVIPSEHCYTLKFLKDITEAYPEDSVKIFAYLFYMYSTDPDANPFFDYPDEDKEDVIIRECEIDFSLDDPVIERAKERTRELYQTPTFRAYEGIKVFLDKMGKSLKEEEITYGRNGNAEALLRMAERFDQVRQSFKGVYRDLMEEQQSQVRGGQNLAYDQ